MYPAGTTLVGNVPLIERLLAAFDGVTACPMIYPLHAVCTNANVCGIAPHPNFFTRRRHKAGIFKDTICQYSNTIINIIGCCGAGARTDGDANFYGGGVTVRKAHIECLRSYVSRK